MNFVQMLAEKGILLSEKQINQFETYFSLLVEWNEKMNLTAITEREAVYVKHFYDSISPAFYFDFTKVKTVCDVGAGTGFPSIPLKICFPHLQVSIVDSLQKRIIFLSELANKLDLESIAYYHDRAEFFGQKEGIRESFDVVTARAVAKMSVLSELCLPLVKSKGTFIAMKSSAAKEEIEEGNIAIQVLGGEIKSLHTFTLPIEESERTIIIIDKKRKTPKKYPRRAGVPEKDPIQ